MADSFKTIDYQFQRPPIGSSSQEQNHRPGRHWCLEQAKLIAGCYRRDEAHDPEAFAGALAMVLSDYPIAVIQYVTDPRTGVAKAFPNDLPNVGQIQEFCDGVQNRQARLERYASIPRQKSKPIAPPPPEPGQHSYSEFLAMAERGEVNSRPIGFFEKAPTTKTPEPHEVEAARAKLIGEIGQDAFDALPDAP